ncbi:fumarylacetoacetate hydrolase [Maribacter vaceletii]|uniref:fumarylacetoacetase n=1 Tax=Maribacter vaceletii TaxID=1206816 RepID=A0A495EDG7_9FLAO|nr:fumarylacetoacetase [Maribacter vaceletii]RKR14924.1 fumarylacetoacetate hydrolase [Maribacter vaceletii]
MKNIDSWISISENSDFSIHNIPFGIFSTKNDAPRAGVAIGDQILDLDAAAELGVFNSLDFNPHVFKRETLNDFIALGKEITSAVRVLIQQELTNPDSTLKTNSNVFISQVEAQMHLPVFVGDYTDFYSSIEHATNVGTMFRDPNNALLPNWRHIPVGYHGRASSIIVSGVNVHRPMGQTIAPDAKAPKYGPSKRVDFELEMAYIIGKKTNLGNTVKVENAEEYIFGKVLFNDWSARDIQKWEYVPLGPFLAKNFASSISPWIVTMEALEPFKVAGPEQKPKVLPYLEYTGERNYDIGLEVAIQPENGEETIVSTSNFKYMYWNMAQQLAHHTMNGCNINVGDMMGSGTISGKSKDSYGSMLELSWAGKNPVKLGDGSERKFIEDNDMVIMRGFCESDEIRVGFGEVRTKLLPVK